MGVPVKRPKVTFLMIAYNTEKYVRQAVESVLNQTEPDVNLLVRNNGSTDGTGDILREIAARDPRVTLFENKRNWRDDKEGHFTKDGAVRIWPLRDKSLLGEYISIIDSDDFIDPDFVRIMYGEAKRAGADIAACGHASVKTDGERIESTLPPDVQAKDLRVESEIMTEWFPYIYRAFRTWWAKLFRTDFFLEHYDYAWATVNGPYGSMFDTLHMLRYLNKAKGFVSLAKELYFFRLHPEGTYSTRRTNYVNAFQIRSVYAAAREFMRACSAGTLRNEGILAVTMWSFWEHIAQSLSVKREDDSPRGDLSWLAVMFNSDIISAHYNSNKAVVLSKALYLTEEIWNKSGGDLSLYTSFFMRLRHVKLELERNAKNPLLYPVVMGCLYDRENKNGIGREFLELLTVSPGFKGLAGKIGARSKWEAGLGSESPDIMWPTPYNYEGAESVKEAEAALEASMEAGDMEEACSLLDRLLALNPLSKGAMLGRIRLCVAMKDWELAAVLAGTAMALWPSDMDTQRLSWELITALPKGGWQ